MQSLSWLSSTSPFCDRMTVNTVPVVDISALMSFATDVEVDAALGDLDNEIVRQMVEEFHAAATEWGFFYITNHGLPDQEIDRFRTAMQSFFRLPRDMKHSIRRHVTNSRGYFDDELTKNKMDWKECFDFAGIKEEGPVDDKHERLGDDENLWLDEKELPGFHQEMIQYYNKMEFLSRRLLKVFAVALGETPAFFDQFFHGDNSSFLRLNHYPLAPESDKIMGVYQHTDAGALTVLLQDDNVASLQVFHRDLQTWMLVPPHIGTFTINIGDMLQVWSNDKFVAPLHRVLAKKDADRLSAPFFYNPSYKAEVKPIVAKEGEEPRYRPLSWREFRLARFQGDYADKGKEIQIDDFKIHGPNL